MDGTFFDAGIIRVTMRSNTPLKSRIINCLVVRQLCLRVDIRPAIPTMFLCRWDAVSTGVQEHNQRMCKYEICSTRDLALIKTTGGT